MYTQLKTQIETALRGNGMRALVLRGSVWLATGSVIEQFARFARNMILARLLAPSAFGTMAIVLSISSMLQSFTDIGVRDALIQNPRGGEREYVCAGWWMAFVRSLSIYTLLFLLAPLVAKFYGNPELSPLLRVAVISVLFEGAMNSRAYILLKEMKFGSWAWIVHGGGICGVVITVVLSFFIRDVWALVIGSCAEGFARCALSYVICPYLPSLGCDRAALRELMKFSRGVFGLSFLSLIFARTDIFVLAKLYPAAQLGLYTMAIYLAQVPASFIMQLLGHIFQPTFARMQGDKARTNRVLILIATTLTTLGMPALVFVFFSGTSVLTFVYGQRYAAAGASLRVASWVALISLLNSEATGVFYAWGLPQLHRRCVAIMAVMMIILTYPLAKWMGPVGGQVACVISIAVGFMFQLRRLKDLTGFDLWQYSKVFVISAAVSAIAAAVCLGARLFEGLARPLPTIIVGFVACLIAYGIAGGILLSGTRFAQSLFGAEPSTEDPFTSFPIRKLGLAKEVAEHASQG